MRIPRFEGYFTDACDLIIECESFDIISPANFHGITACGRSNAFLSSDDRGFYSFQKNYCMFKLLHEHTLLYYNVLNTCDMSRVLLVDRKNLDKNQKIRDKIHNLVDKAYYADPIMYKMDNTMAYLDGFVTE